MKHLNSSAHPRQPANITSTQAPNLNKSQQISTNLNLTTQPYPIRSFSWCARENRHGIVHAVQEDHATPTIWAQGLFCWTHFPIYSIQFEEGLQSSPAIEEVREEKCDSSTQNHRGPFSKPWQVLFTGHGERQRAKSRTPNPEPHSYAPQRDLMAAMMAVK